jgi:hypothetical protein
VPENFLPLTGIVIPASSLSLRRARGLAELAELGTLPYVRLVECYSIALGNGPSGEAVVLDVAVERPQRPVHDIRHSERIAVVFDPVDRTIPEVLALRPDFPWVPHVNLRAEEYPRSLCLYDRPWAELSARWTPAVFVERIRFWLAATARGELHQGDQPLEPLLLHHGSAIVLPADIYADLEADRPIRLDLVLAHGTKECRTLIALRPPEDSKRFYTGLKCVATTFVAQLQVHGLVRRTPRSLSELHSFLAAGGIDLIGSLRERLRNWTASPLLDAKLTIIVGLPLARETGNEAESWNFWVFATLNSLREVGTEIGLWTLHDKDVGLLLAPDETRRGENVEVEVLSPYLAFSASRAAAANAIERTSLKTVAIGAGALGSQVILTLARMGFGAWTIVDEDDLLPHNLARHALHGRYVGEAKAVGVAHLLNQLYEGAAVSIVLDVLRPGDKEQELLQALKAADAILDISASAPVARHLAFDVSSPARRVSVFLNPQGTDLVVLAEDKQRTLTLDMLEVQYYRAAIEGDSLKNHLIANPAKLRYGRSCRDVSSTMSTAKVAMHAALGAELVRTALVAEGATIKVMRCDPDSLAVTPVNIDPRACHSQQIGAWRLVLDGTLLEKLAALRIAKLPNETGGVLIGHYDLDRQSVYVVDTIPSPPDSAEWPTLYIRGSEGLLPQIQAVGDRTAGQLEYVGEWHSHPNGCTTLPSNDDLLVFSWLTQHMSVAGLPALMAIVGEEGSSWYLGEMLRTGGWGLGRPAGDR